MRPNVPDVMEKGRIREPRSEYHTAPGDWYGRFLVRGPAGDRLLVMVAPSTSAEEWQSYGFPLPVFEHVSVSVRQPHDATTSADRCPTWEEMCWVKGLCWGPDEIVVQYHPPEAEYVNHHEFCLHLWCVVGQDFPRPPAAAVGPQKR